MSTHPDLAPGTKLYSIRVVDGVPHFARWTVIGPRADADWVFELRDQDTWGTVARVQTNGSRIYNSAGAYFSTDPAAPLQQLTELTEARVEKLRTDVSQSEALLAQLRLMQEALATERTP